MWLESDLQPQLGDGLHSRKCSHPGLALSKPQGDPDLTRVYWDKLGLSSCIDLKEHVTLGGEMTPREGAGCRVGVWCSTGV